MMLKILLPSEVYTEQDRVTRIVVETISGSFGLLPGRLDCVASLVPGILTYEAETGGPVYVAIDAGVLVKVGGDVFLSVRSALGGTDLRTLREAVEREFVDLDAQEKKTQVALAKMESGFIRRFARFQQERRI